MHHEFPAFPARLRLIFLSFLFPYSNCTNDDSREIWRRRLFLRSSLVVQTTGGKLRVKTFSLSLFYPDLSLISQLLLFFSLLALAPPSFILNERIRKKKNERISSLWESESACSKQEWMAPAISETFHSRGSHSCFCFVLSLEMFTVLGWRR